MQRKSRNGKKSVRRTRKHKKFAMKHVMRGGDGATRDDAIALFWFMTGREFKGIAHSGPGTFFKTELRNYHCKYSVRRILEQYNVTVKEKIETDELRSLLYKILFKYIDRKNVIQIARAVEITSYDFEKIARFYIDCFKSHKSVLTNVVFPKLESSTWDYAFLNDIGYEKSCSKKSASNNKLAYKILDSYIQMPFLQYNLLVTAFKNLELGAIFHMAFDDMFRKNRNLYNFQDISFAFACIKNVIDIIQCVITSEKKDDKDCTSLFNIFNTYIKPHKATVREAASDNEIANAFGNSDEFKAEMHHNEPYDFEEPPFPLQ
jgi:hypothetical protein